MGTISAELCENCVRRKSPCNKCLRDIRMEDMQRGREGTVGWRGLIGNTHAKKDRQLSTGGEKARRKKDRQARRQRLAAPSPRAELNFDGDHWRDPVPLGAGVVHAEWTPPDWSGDD